MTGGFLPAQAISQWKMPSSDAVFLSEDTGEVIVFRGYFELSFVLSTSDFSWGILQYYEIQVPHLSLNSYLHLSIFVHLCEAFLGIDPHFELFLHLFHLKSVPKDEDPKYIRGATLRFKQGMKEKYIPYELKDNYKFWDQEWFYAGNHALSLPTKAPHLPWRKDCWCEIVEERARDQVDAFVEKVLGLNAACLTGARVYMSFLQTRIQLLQVRQNSGYKYAGAKDPDWSMDVVLIDHWAFHYVKFYMKKVEEIPLVFEEFSAVKAPPLVGVDFVALLLLVIW